MIADDLAVVGEFMGREVLEVARKALLGGARENRQVARRGDLFVVGQTGRVAVERAGHAEPARLAGHHLGKMRLVAADRLGDRHGDVVGRARDDRLDRVVDGNAVAGFEPELRGLLGGGVLGDRNLRLQGHRAFVELLEQQVEGHHLGQRRRVARLVLIGGVEGPTGVGVDDDRREGRIGGGRGARDVMIGVMVVTPISRLGGGRSEAQQGKRRAGRRGDGHKG